MEGTRALNWRKSSRSGNNGGDCVEVADASGVVMVRDTKDRERGSLAFTADAWASFAATIK